jgi:uncharacterized protein (TIGR02677 family)
MCRVSVVESVFRRVPADLFSFTTTERADLHTAIMHLFSLANERLATALTFDEVLAGLAEVGWYDPVSDQELTARLTKLVEYRLLDRTQNHGAHYSSAEEYERKNLQYSLTRKGEAAFEGVQHALQVLTSTGALQTAVLDAIADRLDELYRLVGNPDSDNRRIYTALSELESHLQALRTNTIQFNGQLARLLRDEGADLATFHDVKRATVAYLEEFTTNLDQRRHTIAEAAARVERHGVTVLQHRALDGADLPVLPGQPDPAPRWLEQRSVRWQGLRDWFLPEPGERARAEQLRDIARRAIVSLLRVLERLGESRRHRAGTAADFRTLARWFATCATTDDAHRLWVAAFGLWPARHAELGLPDGEPVPGSTSWHDAPAVPVSPLLRTHGQVEKTARTARVRDTSSVRQRRRAAAQRERAELEAAWRRLATPGVVRLSAFGWLDVASFGRLLELLARALATPPDAHGCRRASTIDGRLRVELADPGDGTTATIRTPHGKLTAPNYRVQVAPNHQQSTERAEVGA